MADAATVTIPHSVRTHAPRSATQRVGTGVRGCSRIDRVGVIIGYPTSGAGACRRLVSTHEASGAMAGVALRLVRSDRPIRRGDGSGPMRLRPDLLVQAAGALHIPLGVPIRTPGRKPTRTHLVGSLSLHGRRRKRPELTVLRADKSPRNTVVSPRLTLPQAHTYDRRLESRTAARKPAVPDAPGRHYHASVSDALGGVCVHPAGCRSSRPS